MGISVAFHFSSLAVICCLDRLMIRCRRGNSTLSKTTPCSFCVLTYSLLQGLIMVNDAGKGGEDSEERPSVLLSTASFIIGTEFCERLAYYGFAGSLVLFFETSLDMSNQDSVNQFYIWNGAVYVTPLLGGYIADTHLGRYRTILYFSVLYLMGLGIFLVGCMPTNISPALVFLGCYIVALGAGGIKPNCSTMGADQFDMAYEQDRKESKLFFSYFYWSINLGAVVSYTLVAYICQYGIPFLGGEVCSRSS